MRFHHWLQAPPRHPIWSNPQYMPAVRFEFSRLDFLNPRQAAGKTAELIGDLSDQMSDWDRRLEDYMLVPEGICNVYMPMTRDPVDDSVLFCESGVKRWRGWSKMYFYELASILDSLGLAFPSMLYCDVVGPDLTKDEGRWWSKEYNDERSFRVKFTNEDQTLRLWLNHLQTIEKRSTVGLDPDVGYWHLNNSWFRSMIERAGAAGLDWNMERAVYSIARRHFDNIVCVTRGMNSGYWRRTHTDMLSTVLLQHADTSAPDLCPVDESMCSRSFPADWFMKLSLTSSISAIADIENISASIAARTLHDCPHRNPIPLIDLPGNMTKTRLHGGRQIYKTRTKYMNRLMGIVRENDCTDAVLWTDQERLHVSEWDQMHRSLGDSEVEAH